MNDNTPTDAEAHFKASEHDDVRGTNALKGSRAEVLDRIAGIPDATDQGTYQSTQPRLPVAHQYSA